MAENCLFCRIIAGDIPSQKVWEDAHCYAFRDIHPQAPTHILLVTKRHVTGLNDTQGLQDEELAGCLRAAGQIARQEGLGETGWRLLSNCGPAACQSVMHLHFHILGGRQLSERMD
ncbi:MAG: histidine triad nucleotide-binding protein [Christensenellales bacterium]